MWYQNWSFKMDLFANYLITYESESNNIPYSDQINLLLNLWTPLLEGSQRVAGTKPKQTKQCRAKNTLMLLWSQTPAEEQNKQKTFQGNLEQYWSLLPSPCQTRRKPPWTRRSAAPSWRPWWSRCWSGTSWTPLPRPPVPDSHLTGGAGASIAAFGRTLAILLSGDRCVFGTRKPMQLHLKSVFSLSSPIWHIEVLFDC